MKENKYAVILTLGGAPAVLKRGNPPQIIAQFQRGEEGAQRAYEYVASLTSDFPPKVKMDIEAKERVAASVQKAALAICAHTGLLKGGAV